MNCVVVCVCVYVITKTHEAKLSTCKSDQKFKLKLKFLPNAVASNDDDDDDDVCNSPAPNLTHVQPHPQAIENMVKPRPNSFPHFPHFPGDLSAGRFVKTSISNFNYICFICAGVCAICFLRQTADTEM